MLKYINYWSKAGIYPQMDDGSTRRVFLTNVLSLFIAFVMILLAVIDIVTLGDYVAACRRVAVLIFMILVPFLNQKEYYKVAKSFLLFLPCTLLMGGPIVFGDLILGQVIWFQYVAAIFCAVPFLLFHHLKEKIYIAVFFTYFLLITLLVDRLVLYYSDSPETFETLLSLTQNFVVFKIPPLFIAFFMSASLFWNNLINERYEQRLKSANLELVLAHEEIKAKNEEYEAINQNLETIVEERTKIIESKNRQIIDYANINAHKVRGPLARIMGLINISHYSKDQADLMNIFEKLRPPTQELNKIISEMNHALQQKEEEDNPSD